MNVYAKQHSGNAQPPADMYYSGTIGDVVPVQVAALLMPAESHCRMEVRLIAVGNTVADTASAWKVARYTRSGSGTPGSGTVVDTDTPSTGAGLLTFSTDSNGRVYAWFTADATAVGRGAIKVVVTTSVLCTP